MQHPRWGVIKTTHEVAERDRSPVINVIQDQDLDTQSSEDPDADSDDEAPNDKDPGNGQSTTRAS